jgi:hypothetical protein
MSGVRNATPASRWAAASTSAAVGKACVMKPYVRKTLCHQTLSCVNGSPRMRCRARDSPSCRALKSHGFLVSFCQTLKSHSFLVLFCQICDAFRSSRKRIDAPCWAPTRHLRLTAIGLLQELSVPGGFSLGRSWAKFASLPARKMPLQFPPDASQCSYLEYHQM